MVNMIFINTVLDTINIKVYKCIIFQFALGLRAVNGNEECNEDFEDGSLIPSHAHLEPFLSPMFHQITLGQAVISPVGIQNFSII